MSGPGSFTFSRYGRHSSPFGGAEDGCAVLEVTIRVAEKASSRVRSVLLEAGFSEVQESIIRNVRGLPVAVITARSRAPLGDGEQRSRIGAVEESLAAEGITVELSAHGVAAGEIRSEWLTVVFLDSGATTDFKVSVANRFEVEQELSRIAELLGVQRDRLTVVPRPSWLMD